MSGTEETKKLTLEEKVDKILDFNRDIATTMNNLKIDLTGKMEDIAKSLTTRIEANEADIVQLNKDISPLKKSTEKNTDDITALRTELRTHIDQVKREAVLRDLKSRELNIMIGNIPDSNKWEDREKSIDLVRKFLSDLFAADDEEDIHYHPESITIVDAHRVPQNPLAFFTPKQKR